MKTIKASFVIAFAVVITSTAIAQQYNSKLDGPFTATKTFKVSGVCVMCKHRIENAVKTLSGIWSSEWNVEGKTLVATYDRLKVNPDKIEQRIAAAGHDTRKFKAAAEAYAKLPDCCHYQRKS